MEMIKLGFDLMNVDDSKIHADWYPSCDAWDGSTCTGWLGCNVTYKPCVPTKSIEW